jgi:hypothetical protein
MIDIMYLTQYAQCRVILEALTRAGNRQAQVVQDANVTERDAELAKYYELLGAVNQAQLACDRALLAIASAVVASDQPFSDMSNILLFDIGMYSFGHLSHAIVAELQAITQEAR